MRRIIDRAMATLLAFAFLSSTALVCNAQANDAAQNLPAPPKPPDRSIEDLNYIGGDAAMPPFSDRIDIDPGFHRALLRQGMAFRVITGLQYTQNALDAPVAAENQVYVGQRPFESIFVQPIFTADLRQLNLRNAQLYMGAVWNWVSWNPAGPKSLQMWDLYFYKAFGEDRVEVKAGYISNNMSFVGFFVGGSTAAGTQGAYAVLPYEAGISYFPLTAPSLNLRIHLPAHTYFQPAAQRSLDPNGGPAEVRRNHTGFRFIPHGDKLLLITEAGYLRHASPAAREAWFRAGYLHNASSFKNESTGRDESGNYCAYVLMDYQLTQSNLEHPNHGLYAGGSVMTVPDTKNPYTRYYEARIYQEAPFRKRPGDVASLIASNTTYSRFFRDSLAAQAKTTWQSGTTLTASYSLRASPGNYVGFGLGYAHGPAISPRVPDALRFTASWTLFF